MAETIEEKDEFVRDLDRLAEKTEKYKELISVLKSDIEEAIIELKGLDLSEPAKTEIKETKEILTYLARTNMVVAIAFMKVFLNNADQISDGVKEVFEELIKIKSKIK